jgi:amidophosphoribosyltransferase
LEGYDWVALGRGLEARFGPGLRYRICSTHAVFELRAEEAEVREFLGRTHPDVTIMSAGIRMEIMKEVGSPDDVLSRFNVAEMSGSHAIGHTRMATESAVTTLGSRGEGITFKTDNDSEVAAGYLTSRLRQGDSLSDALQHSLDELDGFYTFTVGTRDGFAVLRDRIACKPAVMAETEDYVAMASEYRSLAVLPGIAQANLWEPEPGIVYSYNRAS